MKEARQLAFGPHLWKGPCQFGAMSVMTPSLRYNIDASAQRQTNSSSQSRSGSGTFAALPSAAYDEEWLEQEVQAMALSATCSVVKACKAAVHDEEHALLVSKRPPAAYEEVVLTLYPAPSSSAPACSPRGGVAGSRSRSRFPTPSGSASLRGRADIV